MQKKTQSIFSLILAVSLFAACKKNESSQDATLTEGLSQLAEIVREDFKENYYIEYMKGSKQLAASAGDTPFPNGNFSEWEEYCYLFYTKGSGLQQSLTQNLDDFKQTVKKDFPNNAQNQAIITWIDATPFTCENIPTAVNDKMIANQASVRTTPKHFLNPRFAQIVDIYGKMLFSPLAITQGTHETQTDNSLITKANDGGITLKNFEPTTGLTRIIVNGLITTGVPRAKGYNSATGLVQSTNTDVPEGIGSLPFKARPTAVDITFSYAPTNNDQATFEFLLHKDINTTLPGMTRDEFSRLPAKYTTAEKKKYSIDGLAGQVKKDIAYVRLIVKKPLTDQTVSVPIYYLEDGTPNYLLVNISAGDGYKPQKGSTLTIKNIEFKY